MPGTTIKFWRNTLLRALPGTTVMFAVLKYFLPDIVWLDWTFRIVLSGTVGIWTNFFAIRMLFHPRERNSFGMQGLIPANRDSIADAIAIAVSEDLLDAEAILGYIEENDLVGKTAEGLLDFAHGWLDNPLNRTKVVAAVGRYIQDRGVEQAEKLLSKGAEFIRNYTSEKLPPEKVWSYFRNMIRRELEKQETIRFLTAVFSDLIEKNVPVIAVLVNRVIEDWINDQGFVTRNALKLGKGIFGIGEEKIRDELTAKVKSPDFLMELMDTTEKNIGSIMTLGDDPVVRKRIVAFFDEQKQCLDDWIRTDGVAAARRNILEFLESETFWVWLDTQLDMLIGKLREFATHKIHSDEFRKTAGGFLLQFARKVEIKDIVRRKINEFDLDQLEELIMKVSGENLCGIELIGGVLGMVAGLTLISHWFIIVLPVLAGLLWLVERMLNTGRAVKRRV